MKQLTEGNILKNILIYSWPIIISDLLQSLYSAIDAIWVGKLIGSDALAAVSSSMPIMFFIVSLLIGLAVSTVIMTGQAFGMKDDVLLNKILVNSFMSMLVLVVIMSTLGVIFAMPILKLLNTPQAIIADAHKFLTIIFSGMIFMFFQHWLFGILRGMGDSITPLKFSAIYVGLNILLAPLLIIGWGPLPKLGIAGSALATVISGFIVSLTAFIYLAKKHEFFNILKWKFEFDLKIIKKIFAIGIPVSLQMIIVSFSAILIIAMVNGFGPDIIATYGIGIRIDQFAFIPAMSLGGSAASAFVAQAIGAKHENKIPEIVKWISMLTMSFAVFFFIIVNLFPTQITSIFTDNAAVINHSVMYFRINTFSYFAFALMFTYQGVIRGSGDTLPSTLFAFISLILFRAGLAYGLVDQTTLKELGVWIGLTVSPYVGLLLNFIYYKSGKWKNKVRIRG